MTLGSGARSTSGKLLVVAIVSAASTACGSTPSPEPARQPAASQTATAAPSAGAPATSLQTVIDVTIADGTVTPTNAQAQAVARQPIVLAVSSDVADELHVHSVPEHSFDVAAQPDQRFEFTVEVPGRVDVELHDLHRTVVTIEVLP
jgi:hypothetical protein